MAGIVLAGLRGTLVEQVAALVAARTGWRIVPAKDGALSDRACIYLGWDGLALQGPQAPGLRVLLVAPLEVRLRRIASELQVDQVYAAGLAAREEWEQDQRARGQGWASCEDARRFHLVINTACLTPEQAASLIVSAVGAVGAGGGGRRRRRRGYPWQPAVPSAPGDGRSCAGQGDAVIPGPGGAVTAGPGGGIPAGDGGVGAAANGAGAAGGGIGAAGEGSGVAAGVVAAGMLAGGAVAAGAGASARAGASGARGPAPAADTRALLALLPSFAPPRPGVPAPIHHPRPPGERPSFAHPSEEEFARVLDFYRVEWLYEPTTFPLEWDDKGNITLAFTPDFYIPAWKLYVELTTMKQSLVNRKNRKIRRLKELYPDVQIKVFYGRDFERLLRKYGWDGTAWKGSADGTASPDASAGAGSPVFATPSPAVASCADGRPPAALAEPAASKPGLTQGRAVQAAEVQARRTAHPPVKPATEVQGAQAAEAPAAQPAGVQLEQVAEPPGEQADPGPVACLAERRAEQVAEAQLAQLGRGAEQAAAAAEVDGQAAGGEGAAGQAGEAALAAATASGPAAPGRAQEPARPRRRRRRSTRRRRRAVPKTPPSPPSPASAPSASAPSAPTGPDGDEG